MARKHRVVADGQRTGVYLDRSSLDAIRRLKELRVIRSQSEFIDEAITERLRVFRPILDGTTEPEAA